MRVELFLGVSFGVFLFLHFLGLPWISRAICRYRSWRTIRWHGAYSLLTMARSAALISSVVSLGVIIFIYGIAAFGGHSTDRIAHGLLVAQHCREVLVWFSAVWVLTGLLLLLAGIAIHAYLSGQRQMRAALLRVAQAQYSALVERVHAGTLEPLPFNAEMQQVASAIEQYSAARQRIETDASLDEPRRALILMEVDKNLQQFQQILIQMDLSRRVDPSLPEAEVALPRPRNWLDRIRMLLVSQGLLRTQSIASRLVYATLLVAFIPASLGLCARPGIGSLDHRMAAMNDLRFQLMAEAAEQDWQAALEQEPATSEINSDDAAVLHQVANRIERSALSANTSGFGALSQHVHFGLRSAATRQRILTAAATHSKGGFTATANISTDKAVPAAERMIAESVESTSGGIKAKSSLGDDIYRKLNDAARRKPGLISRLRSELAAFQQPVKPNELSSGLLGGEIDRVGSRWTPSEQSLLRADCQSRATIAVTDLVEGRASLGQAVVKAGTPDHLLVTLKSSDLVAMRQKLNAASTETIDSARRLEIRLKAERPPAAVAKAALDQNSSPALKTVDRLRASYGGGTAGLTRGDAVADVLGSYTDYFPEQLGAEAKTLRGKILARWNASASKSPLQNVNFIRSRSFGGLSGFSRVGGVLIGRDPAEVEKAGAAAGDSGATLPCRDIQWRWKDQRLVLILVDERGRQHVSRPFRPRLVQQALGYAADSRPLAVTIINTEPLPFRQVLLHPILVDSPLGLRMIELDQWVYRYCGDDAEFQGRKTAEGHILLYRFAQATRVLEFKKPGLVLSDEGQKLLMGVQDEAKQIVELASKVSKQSPALQELLANALKDGSSLRDGDRSPLPKMTDYFDPQLVKWIQEAADATNDFGEFVKLIQRRAVLEWTDFEASSDKLERGISRYKSGLVNTESELRDLQDLEKTVNTTGKTIISWVWPAPEYQEASGVREAPFSLTMDRLFLPEGSSIPHEILNFTVQLAFTSPAFFKPEKNESMPEPWEFAALKPMVKRKVSEALKNSSENQMLLDDVAEFTSLQRLFRVALSGHLGSDFPCEKLAQLGDELAARLPNRTARTPRWDFGDRTPIDAQVEQSLTIGLVSILSAPPETPTQPDLQRMQDLSGQLDELARKLASKADGPSADRDLLTSYLGLLARRMRDVVEVQDLAKKMKKGEIAANKKALSAAWDRYLRRSADWRTEWGRLTVPAKEQIDGETAMARALKLISTARDELALQASLGLTEDAEQCLFQTTLEKRSFPSLE